MLLVKLCFGCISRNVVARLPSKSPGNILYQELQFFDDTNHFCERENTLKINIAKGGLHLRKPTETSSVHFVRSDRCLTLKLLSEQLNLNRFTVDQILAKHLHMRKVFAQKCADKPHSRTEGRPKKHLY